MELRRLGKTEFRVSPVALGCWPISGMTSLDVNDEDSLDTIRACFDAGVNFLDTAYGYGANGESERLIARAIGDRRDELVIATKGGIHWDEHGQRCFDGSSGTLRRQCEESLSRLSTDRVELYYLHAPDPKVPVAESAGALRGMMEEGKIRSVGVSNFNVEQLEQFAAECPITAFQPHYNMLQREIEADTLPWCQERDISVVVYWPLMKGLLAGKLQRDHRFDPRDGRTKYPMFQADEWQKNQDLLDWLRPIAADADMTVAQLVIRWAIHRPGITAALCGAKRPAQLQENAGAMFNPLSAECLARVDEALRRRGPAMSRSAV